MPIEGVFINPLIAFFLALIIVIVGRLLLLGLSKLAGGSKGESEAGKKKDSLGLEKAGKVAAVVALLVFGLCLLMYVSEQRGRAGRRRYSEAKSNLGAIRSTQVAFFAEWSYWIGNQPCTPVLDRSGNKQKVAWDGSTRFSILGFAPEGKVFCSYCLEGTDYPSLASGFTARAECDLDGDGQLSIYWITNNRTEIRHSGAPF